MCQILANCEDDTAWLASQSASQCLPQKSCCEKKRLICFSWDQILWNPNVNSGNGDPSTTNSAEGQRGFWELLVGNTQGEQAVLHLSMFPFFFFFLNRNVMEKWMTLLKNLLLHAFSFLHPTFFGGGWGGVGGVWSGNWTSQFKQLKLYRIWILTYQRFKVKLSFLWLSISWV